MEDYDGSEQKYIENWKRDGHQVDLPTHINWIDDSIYIVIKRQSLDENEKVIW